VRLDGKRKPSIEAREEEKPDPEDPDGHRDATDDWTGSLPAVPEE